MARIPDDELERIKSEVALLDLVKRQGYEVKKQGKDYALLCPFHDEKTPPMIKQGFFCKSGYLFLLLFNKLSFSVIFSGKKNHIL